MNDGGLNHQATTAWVKRFQPNCLVGFSSGQAAGEIQIGEDGRPGPMDHHAVVCPYINNNPFDKWDPSYQGYLITEILQPMIAEPSPMWFYDPSAGQPEWTLRLANWRISWLPRGQRTLIPRTEFESKSGSQQR